MPLELIQTNIAESNKAIAILQNSIALFKCKLMWNVLNIYTHTETLQYYENE